LIPRSIESDEGKDVLPWLNCGRKLKIMEIKGFDLKSLKKTYGRLRKDTKKFTTFHVRDAVDFIDYNYSVDANLTYLMYSVRNESYSPSKPRFHLSPKSKGINRPTVVPYLQDAIIYRYCVEQIEDELLTKTRQKNIRGGLKITARLASVGDSEFYEKWFEDWKAHNDNLEKSLHYKQFLVSSDIASYFENINITLLRDLVRSDVVEKKELLNLLFYFLESTVSRKEYESNTFTGLLQEDFNASRILAFYFLKPHDDAMARFCKKVPAEYYRFVDDMAVLVDSEVEGRMALKAMTESLRRLNLVASLEKTAIIPAKAAVKELFFEENKKLNILEKRLLDNIKKGKSISKQVKSIQYYYQKLLSQEKNKLKNWQKVLKRFYTISAIARLNIFGNDFHSHLIDYPLISGDARIRKFLLRQNNTELNKIFSTLIKYLYSNENLYQQLETNIIETLLVVPKSRINRKNTKAAKELGEDILSKPLKYQTQSEYARALAILICFKFDHCIDKVADIYTKSHFEDAVLRKYFIAVSLTTTKGNLKNRVLVKARKDPSPTIQQFIHLFDEAPTALKTKPVADYFKMDNLYVHYNPKTKFELVEKFDNVRARILKTVLENA
jgi:hypothetical protein